DRVVLPARVVREARQSEGRAHCRRTEAEPDPSALASVDLPRISGLLVRRRRDHSRHRHRSIRAVREELRRGALGVGTAIEVRNVTKHFRLYHEHYASLKERMIHFGRIPYEDFVALADVNMSVEEGTTVGILGHNGSGKSTLLKCIAGILQPNEGEIVT